MIPDKELNELFMVHVAGHSTATLAGETHRSYLGELGNWHPVPDFTADLTTVIQWLDSLGVWTCSFHGDLHVVGLKHGKDETAWGTHVMLAKAAMIACIKSKGIEV